MCVASDTAIVIFIIVAFLLVCKNNPEFFISRESVCTSVDGRCYAVVNKFPAHTHSAASDTLAKLNKFAVRLMRHMRQKYLWNSSNQYYHDMTKFLLHNYDPDKLVENMPTGPENTSFVENKGRTMFALCIRKYIDGNFDFLPDHILQFVTMHEMAHMATRSYGHDRDFWINFKILLIEARAAGLHNPVDYRHNPINYCSLHVDYNPYYDHMLHVPRKN